MKNLVSMLSTIREIGKLRFANTYDQIDQVVEIFQVLLSRQCFANAVSRHVSVLRDDPGCAVTHSHRKIKRIQ